jgi:ribosomal protein S18 acetylase RimI-like enzyme
MSQSPVPPAIDSIAGLIVSARLATTVRPVRATDEPFLRALLADDRAAEFVGMGLTATMVALMLDQQFRAQQAGYRQNVPEADYLVIEYAGAPVGRLTLAVLAGESGRTLHILDLAVLTAARRRGIGSAVIASLAGAALAVGAMRLALSVMVTNTDARRLYERLGFIATNDAGLAITMVKQLR